MKNLMRVALPCFLVSSCMQPAVVWVEPGSTASHLVFGIAKRRGAREPVESLREFVVRSCYVAAGLTQQVFWRVRGDIGDATPPLRITYGEAPAGFSTLVAAKPLVSGCYDVDISGPAVSAGGRFEVSDDRSVAERERRPGS